MPILDSSPVPATTTALPPAAGYQPQPRRPLKRTASTASLPTPPRSVDKRQKPRRDSDGDSSEEESDDDYGRLLHRRESGDETEREDGKARLNSVSLKLFAVTNEQKEDGEEPASRASAPAPATTSAPASPPPSRSAEARSQRIVLRASKHRACKSAPSRPGAGTKHEKPIRDPESNLFLSTSPAAHRPPPRTSRNPDEFEEKPTIAYVFRGVKTHFANPLYGVDVAEYSASLLPPEHPDFSPAPTLRPRMLFPPATPRKGKRSAAHDSDSSEDDEVEQEIKPKKLFSAPEEPKTPVKSLADT